MTDAAIPSSGLHTSHAAKARLASRYAREARFKMLGLLAILGASLFLVVLMASIFWQGYPAFFQNYVTLPIRYEESKIDPAGTRDLEVLRGANYTTLVRDALGEVFPGVTGRSERRALAGLVSSGAGFALRERVLQEPALIGTSRNERLILSDTADLYIKQRAGNLRTIKTAGVATPSAITGTIEIRSTMADFTEVVADLKRRLGNLADDLDTDLKHEMRLLDRLTAELSAAEAAQAGPAVIEDLRSQIAAAQGRASDLSSRIEDLRNRVGAADGSEALTPAMPSYLLHINGGVVDLAEISTTAAKGQVIIPLSSAEIAQPQDWQIRVQDVPESRRKITDAEMIWLDSLAARSMIEQRLSASFFGAGASREPELAGIWGAAVGSFYTMLVTLALAFPIAVAAAIYLEEFAPKNRWTDFIEVNISNLAAVPSIVFGLLGLAVFLNVFGMPRSAPVAGGAVLALMTLPTIIIASRAALKAVPPSIREAALGIGASKVQTVFHHVLPLALPGMLTGTIIGMAQALGETAPLLMIGMVAFIVDIPSGPFDAATVLPVQIYMWADFPEPAFAHKTAAAIMVLLAFLIAMNAVAVLLRKRFERRW